MKIEQLQQLHLEYLDTMMCGCLDWASAYVPKECSNYNETLTHLSFTFFNKMALNFDEFIAVAERLRKER